MLTHWWSQISGARWFQGKGRHGFLRAVRPLPWYTRPGRWPAIRSEIAEISYPDGEVEYYQLLVAYLDELDPGRDIAQDPSLLRILWQAWHTELPETLAPHWDCDLAQDLPAVPFGGQQSHSSILFGDRAQVKLFRHLQPNAEVSILRSLAQGGSLRVPRLLGSVTSVLPGLGSTDLAMIVEQLPSQGDGWSVATAAAGRGSSFAAEAETMGADLKQLHADLAAAYSHEYVNGGRLVADLAAGGSRVCVGVPGVDEALRTLRAAALLDWEDILVQRVHGDLHLGQALASARGWVFVDFEGEPLRPAAERRLRDSVWRDLAGLLRSFDYAWQVTLPGDQTDWVEECRSAFLAGYGWPSQAGRLGRLYELEKAAYEVAYETRNRPDWVGIPLRAVQDIGMEVAAWVAREQEL